MNNTIMAPAYTITSSTETNGAPNDKKIIATARKETTRYNKA
jgi:hypothetical protein